MHFLQSFFISRVFRTSFRHGHAIKNIHPVVKVTNSEDYECIRLTFKYQNSPKLLLEAPKDQKVQMVLNIIKLKAELQKKREEMRREVINKFSGTSDQVVKTVEKDVNVFLFQNDDLLDENIPNNCAWSQASKLKIGDILYKVEYNMPTVSELSLPEYLVAGCPIRPHFILESSTFNDCTFEWYRSDPYNILNEKNAGKIKHKTVGDAWKKVGDSLIYYTTLEDVNCYLKVVCTPKRGEIFGSSYAAVSKNVVEVGSDIFPFELRQNCTKEVSDKDSVRCLSYNILANMYVSKEKKFLYASKKALDVYYRKQLLLREILGYKSDIICLQEVQERVFEYDLLPVMTEAAFEGVYRRKGGRRFEGLATFFRSSKFRILENYGVLLNEIIKEKNIFVDLLNRVAGNFRDMSKLLSQNTALQVILLEDKLTPHRKLLVANTHLYSNKDTPEVRLIQAALCAYYLEHILKTEKLFSSGILFCGDFNSLPNSEAYNFLKFGSFECCPSWKNDSSSNIDTVLRHNLSLDSACGTPDYTNFTDEFHGCLDYIFYSKNFLKVTEIVPMPSHDSVTSQIGLPNEYFPSDHLSLVCTLKWLEKR